MTQARAEAKTNGKPAQVAPAPAPGPTAPPLAGPQALTVPKPKTIRDLIEEAAPKFAAVLPRHLSVDRLVRVTIACINKTPDLLLCTKDSLLNAIMQAAQLGLEPTGVLGSAYLVPFNVKIKVKDEKNVVTEKWEKQAQLIVGYRGLIDLARRSGQIESIEAHVVHENDRFTCRYGLEPTLEHEPCWSGDPGNVKAVYAIAKLKDGGKQVEVMTRAQLDRIMLATQSKGEWGPWKEHREEMDRKTVVRRIAKYLPLTPELADALALDDEAERLSIPETPGVPEGHGTAGLKERLKASEQTVPAESQPEPPHDPVTGEVTDTSIPSPEEQAEILAREAEEAAAARATP